MTNENMVRRIWIAGAVVVLGGFVLVRELIRSGTVAGAVASAWPVQAGLTVLALAAAGAAGYFLDRAYRRRKSSDDTDDAC